MKNIFACVRVQWVKAGEGKLIITFLKNCFVLFFHSLELVEFPKDELADCFR